MYKRIWSFAICIPFVKYKRRYQGYAKITKHRPPGTQKKNGEMKNKYGQNKPTYKITDAQRKNCNRGSALKSPKCKWPARNDYKWLKMICNIKLATRQWNVLCPLCCLNGDWTGLIVIDIVLTYSPIHCFVDKHFSLFWNIYLVLNNKFTTYNQK